MWNYNYQWTPEDPQVDMIYEAQPLVKKTVYQKQVDNSFSFPPTQKAQRVEYDEPNW